LRFQSSAYTCREKMPYTVGRVNKPLNQNYKVKW